MASYEIKHVERPVVSLGTIVEPALAQLPAVIGPASVVRPRVDYTPSVSSVRDAFVLGRVLSRRFDIVADGKGANVRNLPAVRDLAQGVGRGRDILSVFAGFGAAIATIPFGSTLLLGGCLAAGFGLPLVGWVTRWYAKEKATLAAADTKLGAAEVATLEKITGPVMRDGDALAQITARNVLTASAEAALGYRALAPGAAEAITGLTEAAPVVGDAVQHLSLALIELGSFVDTLETKAWLGAADVARLRQLLAPLSPHERAAVNAELASVFFDGDTPRKNVDGANALTLMRLVTEVPDMKRLGTPAATIPAPSAEGEGR